MLWVPFVVPKAAAAPYSRTASLEDTTTGWHIVDRRMMAQYGVGFIDKTAENVAEDATLPLNVRVHSGIFGRSGTILLKTLIRLKL